jgi:hypothetical protein
MDIATGMPHNYARMRGEATASKPHVCMLLTRNGRIRLLPESKTSEPIEAKFSKIGCVIKII